MLSPRAEKIIHNHVIMSVGIAAIPIPMLDVIMIYYVQMDMIKQLAEHYGKYYYHNQGKSYVSALVTVTIARMGASLIKAIPGVGSLVGGASSIVLSGASTFALGKVTARFFQDHIELADIDMDLAKSIFKEEFKIGKTRTQDIVDERQEKRNRMSPEQRAQKEASEKEIYKKLTELEKLRKENLITAEEYEVQRRDLISQFDLE